jgi:hypothetical protein
VEKVSDELEQWLTGDEPKTLDSLVALFGERSFAIIFVLLMALPALPLPTGGATHVLEVVTMLLALELIAGRREIWLPQRWRRMEVAGASRGKVLGVLVRRIRWVERFSRPRGTWLFEHRAGGVGFGIAVLGLALTAFLAPPFSGLDTLPAIGVVALALGFLMKDVVVATAGLVVGVVGIATVVFLGNLAVKGVRSIF